MWSPSNLAVYNPALWAVITVLGIRSLERSARLQVCALKWDRSSMVKITLDWGIFGEIPHEAVGLTG